MKLIFKGVVQGVGFRPTIYRLAKKQGLKGYVLNKGSEVEVVIDRDVERFIEQVKKDLPKIAEITEIVIEEDNRTFKDFRILESEEGERKSLIPADVGICEDCLKEMFDPKNRRYLFPFTNCTICGARFSLIKDVPYDRERTSMGRFKLCQECQKEYTDVNNRRYHAQTISCPACGPSYTLYAKDKKEKGKNAIKEFARHIDAGEIGIIKSWGGMHICCKISEVKRFREWYKRPQKSFAVMVKDIDTARKYGKIETQSKELLLSPKRPIVLVEKKRAEEVSPGLNTIGLFLPYTGLHYLLFSLLEADALIMTSANIPGEPMLTRNDGVFSLGADVYLLHNRDIPNRIDDSVVKPWRGKTFFLRKSRGYVPEPLSVTYNSNVLSVGADENVTGAISANSQIYCTQYIGNSKYYYTLAFLEESLRHLIKLFAKSVDAVAMDLHPAYDTRRIAKKFAEEFGVPLFEVQHDFAHAASLLVDNNVQEVVALVIEGLGYGSDKTLWGSEVLEVDFKGFKRVGHLSYIPLLGGDQAARDPRRLVFAIFRKMGEERFFTGKEAKILTKLMDKSIESCSLGRYLDALSCFLGICSRRTYSGEPAMKLERYLAMGKKRFDFEARVKNNVVDMIDLFKQLDEKMGELKEREKADLSYSFVKTIMDSLTEIAISHAQNKGIEYIGLTGGVSYNIPITEMVSEKVEKAGLELLVHNRVPNGDGGISVGQNAIVGHGH